VTFGTTYEGIARTSIAETADPNHVGASLILPFVVGVSKLFERGKTRLYKSTILLILLLFGGAFIGLGSRGAIVGTVTAVLTYFVLNKKRTWIILFSAACLCVFWGVWNNTDSRFSGAEALSSGGAGRVAIWEVAQKAIAANWLIGGGIGNFPMMYDQAMSFTEIGYSLGFSRSAHNTLMSMLAELGIIGVILFLAFLLRLLKTIRKIMSEKQSVLIASLSGVLISSMFLDILDRKYFWLIILLLYGVKRGDVFYNSKKQLNTRQGDIDEVFRA
jgi:O-antigen ligase